MFLRQTTVVGGQGLKEGCLPMGFIFRKDDLAAIEGADLTGVLGFLIVKLT